jgi:glucokinase
MDWPAGVVSPVNIPAWRSFPLKDHMTERFGGGRPVAIHNDAVALALAEHRWGAGRGTENMLGMVVSTGVGGGLILNGRRIDGHTGNAGHVGHIVAEYDGPPCNCGGRGCVERIARGPSIVAHATELGWAGEPTGRALADGARGGDAAALAAFARAGRAVGVAVASIVAALDLELVVVGGGIAQSGEVFFGPLTDAFNEHAGMEFVRRCRIVPSQLGYLAGISGAAAVVMQEFPELST